MKNQLLETLAEIKQINPFDIDFIMLESFILQKDYLSAFQIIQGYITYFDENKIKYPKNIEKLSKGIAIKFNDEKRIILRSNYKNGLLNGEYKSWYYYINLPKKHCYYKEGVLHGEYKGYSSTGVLIEHCYYKEGVLHGEYKSWDCDGQLKQHCYYENGVVNNYYK